MPEIALFPDRASSKVKQLIQNDADHVKTIVLCDQWIDLAQYDPMRSKPTGLSTTFSLVLERHRKAKELSRQALAERAGLHQTYIGLVERGSRNPSLDVAERLANALGEKLSDLISEAELLQKKSNRK